MPQGAQKIVVTGGAGFIGSHLVDRLLGVEGGDVVVLDNLSRGRLSNLAQHRASTRLRVMEGDVRDAAAVADALQDAAIVYHLAAQSTVMGAIKDPSYTFNTNVVGTFNVLRAASQSGVERLVFASSRDVYGEPINLPVEEEAPLLAINSYGASKVAGEAYCRAFRREMNMHISILRFSSVYGPRDFGRVIPLWIEQTVAGQELQIYGGKQVIDVVWIQQVIEAMVRAAGLDRPLPATNVASGTGTRVVDLARRIGRLTSSQTHIRLQPARPMDVTRFVANVDRMRQLLDLDPPLDPLANLADMIGAPVGV